MILTCVRDWNIITADFHLIAECFQFLLQVIFSFLFYPLGEIFRTEFLVLTSVIKHMPYRFQDRVSYCHQSSFLAPVGCQPVITCAIKGILSTCCCPGSLRNDGFQMFVAMRGPSTFFTCAFIISRTHTGPRSQILFRGEGFHVDTYFRYQVFYCFPAKSKVQSHSHKGKGQL